MRKLTAIFLAALMVVSLAACASKPAATEAAATAAAAVTEAATTAAAATEATTEAASAEVPVAKFQWTQANGIDTLFESPHRDQQHVGVIALWETLNSPVGDGTYIPKLATDYEVSADGLTYTYTLREGVTWSDGEPFTADDVLFSMWAVIADPTSNFASKLTDVEGYDDVKSNGAKELSGVTADGNKICFKLSNPNSCFALNVSGIYILPKHLLGEVAAEELETYEAYWTKPIGTGCWKIDEVSFPDFFTMVPNETYWGGQSKIQKALFTSYQTGGGDALVAGLIAGDVDFAYGNNVNDIEAAKNICAQNADMAAPVITSTYYRFFLFNCGERADGNIHEDIKNNDVRKAIAMLIDREGAASCYNGQSVALTTLVNPNSGMYNKNIPAFQRDVEGAKALLDAAGFDYSQELNIAYYYNDQNTIDIMDMIVQNLADAGVKAEAHLLTGDLGTQLYTDCNFDMVYCGGSNLDPIQYYHEITSESYYTMLHAVEERGAIFDDLWAAYKTATNDVEAKAAADALQVAGQENVYEFGIYSLNNVVVYNQNKLNIPDAFFNGIGQYGDWDLVNWEIK